MFSGPLGKLVLIILVAASVWYGWKYVRRIQDQLAAAKDRPRAQKPPPREIASEDMQKCRACGAYVAAAAGRCDRADCPF
jgi:hypothetical protein